ncbi:peptide ligase PGM1-related protein [Streptomyces sp. 147326]|uniref:peptide ligase PGM1-related protein n=1 Tax=Streptomyces sp. 147326 TaxID=3074379 RepID=UPI003857AB64
MWPASSCGIGQRAIRHGRCRRADADSHGLRRGACPAARTSRLAFHPERGEGVVLYADAPPDGRSWRYAVIARSAGDVEEREAALGEVLDSEGG